MYHAENNDNHLKTRQLKEAHICIISLKADLEKEHQNWHTTHSNYEKQVVLQGETTQDLGKPLNHRRHYKRRYWICLKLQKQ